VSNTQLLGGDEGDEEGENGRGSGRWKGRSCKREGRKWEVDEQVSGNL
jgi:hypothetical protein